MSTMVDAKAYTYSSRKGAGPVRIMLQPKIRRPANIISPYFIPFLSSLTTLRQSDVKTYAIVSIEKMRPICVTVSPCDLSMTAKMGSLYDRHIKETAKHIAIVIIFCYT